MAKDKKIRIGIIGCGCIGSAVARFVVQEMSASMTLEGIYDLEPARIEKVSRLLKRKIRMCTSIDAVIRCSDVVIEAASGTIVAEVVGKCINAGKDVVAVSVGGLLGKEALFKKAQQRKVHVYMPSGAICGIDALSAFPVKSIRKLTLTTTKSPLSLADIDGVSEHSKEQLLGPKVIFHGSARAAIKQFPKNINVSALLVLASGYKNVRVCIKEDPAIHRNIHDIVLESTLGSVHIRVENIPSPDNPRTSYLTILSVQNLLRKLVSYVRIGS